MGKAVPKNVKRRANDLLEAKPEWFATDFSTNKGKLALAKLPLTKKVRNRVAGFITRKKVQQARLEAIAAKKAAKGAENAIIRPAAPRAEPPTEN